MAHDVFRVRGRGLRGPGLTSEQQADLAAALLATGADRAVANYDGRNDIPVGDRVYGMRRTVALEYVEAIDPSSGQLRRYYRPSEWSQKGADSVPGWHGLKTEPELLNRGNHVGTQGQDTIQGLVSDLATLKDQASFARLALTGFSVTPSQAEVGDTITSLDFAWSRSGGAPNGAVITRADGQRIWWLRGNDASADTDFGDLTPAGLLVIGDSQPYEWGPGYAAALGLTLVNCALYAQTSRKQALRVGAYPLTVTLASNSLPAAGTQGTVTTMNGGPTTIANDDAILHAFDGDTATHTIDGILTVPGDTAHVRMTHAAGSAEDVIKIERIDAGGAVTVTADALFVPDYKAMLATTHRAAIMVGHNSMRQDDPVGSFAGIRADIDAIMAVAATNPHPVELYDFWPADNSEERALIPWIEQHSAWLRDKYPGSFATDGDDRSIWERLRNSEKVIPASLRETGDSLHLNATGEAEWVDHAVENDTLHLSGVTPITGSTSFELSIRGAVPGYDAIEETRTVSIPFLHRRYWGVSASATLNSAGVVGLGGTELSNARAKEFSVMATDQYVYYAYPAALGDHTLYKLYGVDETPVETTVSVTKANGATISYTVLRSPLKQTGSVSVEVQ